MNFPGLSRFGLVSGASATTTTIAAGLLISHSAHWLAVVQVWALTKCLVGGAQKSSNSSVPFFSAMFHILSPAGIFLSAPYTESLFAFLSISGFLGYVYATQYFDHARVLPGCLAMVAAGVFFGAATMIRSNGILAGIPYAIQAVTTTLTIIPQGFTRTRICQLASVVVGGSLVGVGMITPQFLAYLEYCRGRNHEDRRPWCDQTIPSIFTWTQSYYWWVYHLSLCSFFPFRATTAKCVRFRYSGMWVCSDTGQYPIFHFFSLQHLHCVS